MKYFITGTDTEVGKTYTAVHLLKHYQAKGYQTLGLKPIATDCKITENGLRNDDALQLQAASSISLPYDQINPFAFEEPISPNIAAANADTIITAEKTVSACQAALSQLADSIIIESAGGWFSPINQNETMADLAIAFNFPIILVVAIRLGCLNQALLTYHHLKQTHLNFHGWVANCLDQETLYIQENIDTLRHRMGEPMLIL